MACGGRAHDRARLGGAAPGCLGGRPTAWVGCGGAWWGWSPVGCDGPGEVLQDLGGPAVFNFVGVHRARRVV